MMDIDKLKVRIRQCVRANQGGVKFPQIIVELAAYYADDEPELLAETVEIACRQMERDEEGIKVVDYTWRAADPQARAKMFVCTI